MGVFGMMLVWRTIERVASCEMERCISDCTPPDVKEPISVSC